MTDILRQNLLQSKHHEKSLIATSRKRKLREFFAIANSGDGIPNIPQNFLSSDAPAPTPAEARFLEDNDLQSGRTLNEATIPTRRQLRSHTAKLAASSASNLDASVPEQSRLLSPSHREDGGRKSRATTPAKDGLRSGGKDAHETTPRRGRSAANTVDRDLAKAKSPAAKVSTPDLPIDSLAGSDNVVNEPLQDADGADEAESAEPGPLEEDRVKNIVESRPGSPGVDPRKAIPISAEDAAQLVEPVINGSQDAHHKAATVHLPPREVQERHLKQVDRSLAHRAAEEDADGGSGSLSIKLPPANSLRSNLDPMSSPGSTVGAHSATTPALHDASTDTSPDNEGPRYNGDRLDKKEIPQTPPELLPTAAEAHEKEEHDKILRAQMEIARAEILGSSPTAPDEQLRLEEEQAAAAQVDPDKSTEAAIGDRPDEGDQTNTETAQDLMDDEEDEVVGVPTPEDDKAITPDAVAKPPPSAEDIRPEEAALSDAMEIDTDTQDQKVDKSSSDVSVPADSNVPSQPLQSPEKLSRRDHKDVSSTSTSSPQSQQTPAVATPTPERMTTRVSSGAMRHKSVSEILGEIPKPNTIAERPQIGKGAAQAEAVSEAPSQSRSSTPQSTGSRIRSIVERAKEKDRSKLSTVVFAKQSSSRSTSSALVPSTGKPQDQATADYFMPLILSQAYNATRGFQPLEALLQSAHKTITTSNAYIPFQEHQTHKVLRRIHNLQGQDKWSFRQPKRSPEPNRPTAHWDELLKEAKWMRTDFREERKWKMAVARNLAYACAEWVDADADDRKSLQVKAVPPPKVENSEDVTMEDGPAVENADGGRATPDLVPSAENDSPSDEFDEEPRLSVLDTIAPTTLFSLSDDDVVFGLRRTPATDKLLQELPLYDLPLTVPSNDLPTSEVDPDASWRRPAIPLSKYINGKIVLKEEGPPRKKSRYQYEEEDDDEDEVVFGGARPPRPQLAPVQTDVALFNPENKHIRDRIHAGHQFRPPSEYAMPLQSFFECRSASQWTWAEDDELKTLVREYQYNWSLISNMLTSRSLFASGAERRTPWECFERWIHLEGLPADMQKTHYFRAYNNRLEAAQRNLLAQAAQVPQQTNGASGAVTPMRRRSTTSVRVERRRNQKHLSLVDAMRKLAKKRETALQKQQHAAGLAAMRKANEVPQPPTVKHTPQDFSRLKHEREVQLQERMARMAAQQEAQRRAMQQQARNQQQNPQQFAGPNGVPQQARNPAANGFPVPMNQNANGNRPNQLAVPGQNVPHAQMQPMPNGMAPQGGPMPNGHGGMPQMPMKIPPAQMQQIQQMQQMQGMPGVPGMQGQQRLPVPNQTPDLRLVMQARQISEQQRQAVQMQQQQQHQNQNSQGHNSSPNMRNNVNVNGINQQAFMQNNQQMMAAYNGVNTNGISTPPTNGLTVPPNGSAGSPHMAQMNQQGQYPNGGISQVPKLEAQIRASYPNATPEQVRKMVSDSINQSVAATQRQQISQSAMHAAAGAANAMPGLPAGMQNSPQQYAQMLRAQQERQAAAAQQSRSASAGSGTGAAK